MSVPLGNDTYVHSESTPGVMSSADEFVREPPLDCNGYFILVELTSLFVQSALFLVSLKLSPLSSGGLVRLSPSVPLVFSFLGFSFIPRYPNTIVSRRVTTSTVPSLRRKVRSVTM